MSWTNRITLAPVAAARATILAHLTLAAVIATLALLYHHMLALGVACSDVEQGIRGARLTVIAGGRTRPGVPKAMVISQRSPGSSLPLPHFGSSFLWSVFPWPSKDVAMPSIAPSRGRFGRSTTHAVSSNMDAKAPINDRTRIWTSLVWSPDHIMPPPGHSSRHQRPINARCHEGDAGSFHQGPARSTPTTAGASRAPREPPEGKPSAPRFAIRGVRARAQGHATSRRRTPEGSQTRDRREDRARDRAAESPERCAH